MAWAALSLTDTFPQALAASAALISLLALFEADLRWFRLPDVLTLSLFASALALAWLETGRPGPALGGAAIGAGAFLALALGYRGVRGRDGMGMGDVKLMAGLGAFNGLIWLPWIVLGAATSALALILMRYRGRPPGDVPAPFGSYLAVSAIVFWLVERLVSPALWGADAFHAPTWTLRLLWG